MMQRLLVTFTAFALLAAGYAQEDGEVTLFVRTGPEAEGLRAVAEEFTQGTGIAVELMEIGRSGYFSTMTTQLVSGTDAFDLVATNSAYVAPLAASGALEPLESCLAEAPEGYNAEDILFTYGYNGETYSIPFDVSTHFLYYREDLINEPPRTWDEYLELAKGYTQSLNADSPTRYGAALTALPGPELPKVFYSVMWSMGGEIMDEDGSVLVDSPDAVEAAEYYRSLVDAGVLAPDIISWGFPNVLDALRTGQVAMAGPYWNAAYPQIQASDSPYKDQIAITLIPGVRQDDGSILRTPFQHGWAFVMNANSDNKELACGFLQYATSEEGMLIYAQNGGTPARRSVLQNPDLQPREYYDLMLESLEMAEDEPAVPYYLEMHEVMNQALSNVLTTSQEPAAVMEEAAERIRELQ